MEWFKLPGNLVQWRSGGLGIGVEQEAVVFLKGGADVTVCGKMGRLAGLAAVCDFFAAAAASLGFLGARAGSASCSHYWGGCKEKLTRIEDLYAWKIPADAPVHVTSLLSIPSAPAASSYEEVFQEYLASRVRMSNPTVYRWSRAG